MVINSWNFNLFGDVISMSNYCISCVYGLKHDKCNVLTEEREEEEEEKERMTGEEYSKLLNRELLLNNDRLANEDNIMGIDCVTAPSKNSEERKKLEILFKKLRKERNSNVPYLSEWYIHWDSSRAMGDW